MSHLLHYEERGSGPCVVMLHPTPVDHHFWVPVAALLEPGYRVVMPDLAGHGLSPLHDRPATMQSLGRGVLQLLDALAVDQAIFFGCSLGGYLLYELWRQAPERIRALAICSAKPHADSGPAKQRREETIAAIEQHGTAEFFGTMAQTLVGEPAQQRDPEITHQVKAMMQRMSPASAVAIQRALASRPDSRSTASSIRVPTAVLAGSLDQGSTPAEMRELADAVPDSTFYLLQEMGHYAPFEQARLVGSLLRRFADANTS